MSRHADSKAMVIPGEGAVRQTRDALARSGGRARRVDRARGAR